MLIKYTMLNNLFCYKLNSVKPKCNYKNCAVFNSKMHLKIPRYKKLPYIIFAKTVAKVIYFVKTVLT